MKLLLAVPVLLFAFLLPLITGLMVKDSPYRFWLCFYISIAPPPTVSVIIFCLAGWCRQKAGKLEPVENEEIFDHLFISKNKSYMLSRR